MAKRQSSAEKRHKQSEVRRLRNKSIKTAIRTSAKKVVIFAQKKDKEKTAESLRDMIKKIDSAARKGIIKKNTAARKKSRMQKLYNRVVA